MNELTVDAVHGKVHAHAAGYWVPYAKAASYESILAPIGNGLQVKLVVVLGVVQH